MGRGSPSPRCGRKGATVMDVQLIGDSGVARHRAGELPALLERGQGLVQGLGKVLECRSWSPVELVRPGTRAPVTGVGRRVGGTTEQSITCWGLTQSLGSDDHRVPALPGATDVPP